MKKINLKSNLLIKLFGRDEITLKELQEMNEFILDGQGISFTEEEIENIKSDLVYVFKELNESTSKIYIANCPDFMKDYIIKNAPTPKIYFKGREDLKENWIDVSDELEKYCGKIKTEYELFSFVKDCQTFNSKPVITVKDFDIIQKYANIYDFKIKIKSKQEYQTLLQMVGDENVEVYTSKNILQEIVTRGQEVPSNLNFYIEIENMSELSVEELNFISDKTNIKSVYIPATSTEFIQEKDNYSIEEYTMLKDKVDTILSQVDNSKPEFDRFMQIYRILGESIEYEYDDDGEPTSRAEAYNLKGRIARWKMCMCGICKNFTTSTKIFRNRLQIYMWNSKRMVGFRKNRRE